MLTTFHAHCRCPLPSATSREAGKVAALGHADDHLRGNLVGACPIRHYAAATRQACLCVFSTVLEVDVTVQAQLLLLLLLGNRDGQVMMEKEQCRRPFHRCAASSHQEGASACPVGMNARRNRCCHHVTAVIKEIG